MHTTQSHARTQALHAVSHTPHTCTLTYPTGCHTHTFIHMIAHTHHTLTLSHTPPMPTANVLSAHSHVWHTQDPCRVSGWLLFPSGLPKPSWPTFSKAEPSLVAFRVEGAVATCSGAVPLGPVTWVLGYEGHLNAPPSLGPLCKGACAHPARAWTGAGVGCSGFACDRQSCAELPGKSPGHLGDRVSGKHPGGEVTGPGCVCSPLGGNMKQLFKG